MDQVENPPIWKWPPVRMQLIWDSMTLFEKTGARISFSSIVRKYKDPLRREWNQTNLAINVRLPDTRPWIDSRCVPMTLSLTGSLESCTQLADNHSPMSHECLNFVPLLFNNALAILQIGVTCVPETTWSATKSGKWPHVLWQCRGSRRQIIFVNGNLRTRFSQCLYTPCRMKLLRIWIHAKLTGHVNLGWDSPG